MGIQARHTAQRYQFFTRPAVRTGLEDSYQGGFKAYNSPFCIRGAVMGFPYLKIPLYSERVN